MNKPEKNPLVGNLDALNALPKFSSIQPEHVVPAVQWHLEQCRSVVNSVIDAHKNKTPTWESFVEPLEESDDVLERAWSPVGHLNSVMNSDELRDAYNECLPLLSEYSTEMGQNKDLYQLTKAMVDSDDFSNLSKAQKKSLEDSLIGFELSGIGLDETKQKRFGEIKQALSDLTSKFEQNLLDANKAWTLHLEDDTRLSGLPESSLAMLKQNAEQEEKSGYLLNLQIPCYIAVMTYADDADLRETMYKQYVTRASEFNDESLDNTKIIQEILTLRQELARLLGFKNYAELSIKTKMAESPEQVIEFLENLAKKSKPIAQKELEELKAFAKEKGCEKLNAWDMGYYSEKLQNEQYSINQEMLKPWFSAPKVIQGLFDIIEKLYGVKINQKHGVDTYHDEIEFYEIKNGNDELLGAFFLDLYARQNKRGGAWMDVCISRYKKSSGLQYPVAYLTCNSTPPVADKPALLTHDEVITLFHEFGHGLHHMLTQVDYPAVSGISGVEWDAVELPSQFMENWCWEREALDLFARHYETNEPLPDDLFNKMKAAKNFHSAMQMVRQIEFSLFDLILHMNFDENWQATENSTSNNQVQDVLNKVREKVSVVIPPEFNRFQNGFSHIFAGGYAAGYYSYKWAEVLSADAFSKFEETGIFNQDTGKKFLESVLEQGGSQPAMESFKEFMGREPNIDALLRHSGLPA